MIRLFYILFLRTKRKNEKEKEDRKEEEKLKPVMVVKAQRKHNDVQQPKQ